MSGAHTGIRPPLQGRSQRTLERILAAAQRVLLEKTFDEATLAEITEEAGVTVGAFYARFPDKDALFSWLEAQLYEALTDVLDPWLDAAKEPDRPLAELIEDLIERLGSVYRERRGIGRAVVLRSRSDRAAKTRRHEFNRSVVEDVGKALRDRQGEIAHEKPDLALRIGFLYASSALRETLLFQDYWPGVEEMERVPLERELARSVNAYLGLTPTAG